MAKKANKPKAVKEGFFKGVRKELKLVKWPTWSDVIKNTIATIVLCLIICGYFLALNAILSFIKGVL